MKKANRIFASCMNIILCFILLSLPASAVLAGDDSTGGALVASKYYAQINQTTQEIEENQTIEYELSTIYEEIDESMKISSTSNVASGSTAVYSSGYAGAYIDGESLVVCVTDSALMPGVETPNVSYKLVEYSYNDLANAKSQISSQYETYYALYDGTNSTEETLLKSIAGIGIDEEYNKLCVDILNITGEKIDLFLSLFGGSEEMYLFQEAGSFVEDQATYKPGVALYVITGRNGSTITSYSRLSMGYRAYLGSKTGFATAGHGIKESVDGIVYANSSCTTQMGTVQTWIYGGSVDASFIEMNSGNSVGTTTHYSDSSGSTSGGDTIRTYFYMTSVPKNSTVYKVGSTTYKTSAKVTSTNYDFTVEGQTFTNLTKTESFTDSGDSGGLVYMYFEDSYVPAGLVKGGGGVWIFSYSVYVKATEVLEQMNVYPY